MDLRLIVITDARIAAPRAVHDVVRAALEAGAPAIQLRDKRATAAELYQHALQLVTLTRKHGALLFINDRLDIALAAGADGVHLGPHDLPVLAARQAARQAVRQAAQRHGRPDLLLGYSTDDPHRARQAARDGADYIGCGAVFGTTSKTDVGDERIGTDGLAEVVRSVPVPVVGIGGINPDNVHRVRHAGAAGAAVIGAVMAASDVEAAVRALLAPF
jgi:thiamine-phosphate pyrophosphorylase